MPNSPTHPPLQLHRFEIPGLAQYSYLIASNGVAAIIDPIRDIDTYLTFAADHNLRITHVLETHIHADFASGAAALAQITGAELALSAHDQAEHYQYAIPHVPIADGHQIQLGALTLQAIHTPGHTPEHLSFLLADENKKPLALFTGDFLFVGSLGRPDLLGDDAKLNLARELHQSLHTRIAHLPDALPVYPGHGAGSLCGAGMSDLADSTLGRERAHNTLFALPLDAFITEILASVPPMPTYYPRMKVLNSAGAAALPEIPGANPLTPEEVADLANREDVILLDLRRPESFGGAHIPTSINIGSGPSLSLWAGWLLDPKKSIVLISDSGDDEHARRALVRVGLDQILGHLDRGMPAWIDHGLPLASAPQLSTLDFQHLPPETLILDVRTPQEFRSGHIAHAHHIMLGNLPAQLPTLPRDRPIALVCGSGYRSSIAAGLLAAAGIHPLGSLAGGMAAWNFQHLPTTPGDA